MLARVAQRYNINLTISSASPKEPRLCEYFHLPWRLGKEGFTSEKDIFDRCASGKGLTNIVCQVTDPLVIAIDNEWGTGKTTFLKMWAGELRKQEIPVIFFDAFPHDYVEDAFTAIAGEIVSLAADKQKQDEPTARKFIKSSVGAAKIRCAADSR